MGSNKYNFHAILCKRYISSRPHLRVVLLNFHFNIKAGKLTQMPMRKGVLCSEDRSDFKYPLKVAAYSHLLVKLRRLCQTCWLSFVIQLEHS